MKLGLVLGAGGTVGMAYHVGVLRALQENAGIVPAEADLVIGTSAGAVIGAYLRSGLPVEAMWQQTFGDGEFYPSNANQHSEHTRIFAPAFRNPIDLVQHLLGSAFVLSRSVIRVPLPSMPGFLRQAFPGGMLNMAEGRHRLETDLPVSWPESPLWLCAVDIVSGQRVVLGRPGAPGISLPRAVMASAAIPGVYPPIPLGKQVLVDGGVHSSTNLDLASSAGCDVIIGIAPMAYDTDEHRSVSMVVGRIFRRPPAVTLAHEMALARSQGAVVVLIRPTGSEVAHHGVNMMRREGLDEIARRAYEATIPKLSTDRFVEVIEQLRTGRQPRSAASSDASPVGAAQE